MAYLGKTVALWVRRAQVRIVADAFFEDTGAEARFWSLDAKAQASLMRALAATGARAVVMQSRLRAAPPPGWRRIGGPETDPSYFVSLLERGDPLR